MTRTIPSLAATVIIFLIANTQMAQSIRDQVGQRITPWVHGTLDIHQISTGRGNAALVVMPDGTTLLEEPSVRSEQRSN